MGFQIGNIVILKSGEPKMTVFRVIGSEDSKKLMYPSEEYLKTQGLNEQDVVYQWFFKNKLLKEAFKKSNLSLVED